MIIVAVLVGSVGFYNSCELDKELLEDEQNAVQNETPEVGNTPWSKKIRKPLYG